MLSVRQVSFALLVAGVSGFFAPVQAMPRIDDSIYRDTCDAAAGIAARETGVPLDILKAIARTESGLTSNGKFTAWPWAINNNGHGRYFESKSKALRYVRAQVSNGIGNIDLGCFQINLRWHGENFSSFDRMIDPVSNARYAAGFLSRLHAEFGSWNEAVASFHSRNAIHSRKYMQRFHPILAELRHSPAETPRSAKPRFFTNAFPLLTGGSPNTANGSLFPDARGTGRSLLHGAEMKN